MVLWVSRLPSPPGIALFFPVISSKLRSPCCNKPSVSFRCPHRISPPSFLRVLFLTKQLNPNRTKPAPGEKAAVWGGCSPRMGNTQGPPITHRLNLGNNNLCPTPTSRSSFSHLQHCTKWLLPFASCTLLLIYGLKINIKLRLSNQQQRRQQVVMLLPLVLLQPVLQRNVGCDREMQRSMESW